MLITIHIPLGRAGNTTVLVLSGETGRADLGGSQFQPDVVVEDLGELVEKLL